MQITQQYVKKYIFTKYSSQKFGLDKMQENLKYSTKNCDFNTFFENTDYKIKSP